MAKGLLSLKDFLQERHLTHKNDFVPLLDVRQRLEKSLFLETMRDIFVEINAHAGTVIVEEHHYLPPEPIISSYMFKRGQTEYVMRLELWGPTPCLAFITRKWRDDSSNRISRWIYRLAGMEPISVNIKISCELPAEGVSGKDQTLSRSYIPSFQPCKESVIGILRNASRIQGKRNCQVLLKRLPNGFCSQDSFDFLNVP